MSRRSKKNNPFSFFYIEKIIERQDWIKSFVLLGLRAYLAPIFIIAGWSQLNYFEQTLSWLGDDLKLFYPYWLSLALIGVQLLFGTGLLIGFFTRLCSLFLSFVVLAAITIVQWGNGWSLFIQDGMAIEKLNALAQQYGNFDELTYQGNIVIFTNGIELNTLYLLTLLTLFSYGSGSLSIDHLLHRRK